MSIEQNNENKELIEKRIPRRTEKSTSYHWKFYSEEHDYYFEYSKDLLYGKGALLHGKERTKCIEVELYKLPENTSISSHVKNCMFLYKQKVEFIKKVFIKHASVDSIKSQRNFNKLILPPAIYHEILNVIKEFDLLVIKDLLLEIIAIVQDIYTREVSSWENPERKKLIRTAEKEAANVIQIIEQTYSDEESTQKFDGKIKPQLNSIKFEFNTGTIKLDHEDLAKEFVKNMMRDYDDRIYSNWRKELAHFHERYEMNFPKAKFKYQLAISYYNLLTECNFFNTPTNVEYSNKLLLCIAKLIEFSLIPVGKSDDTNKIKITNIRNWLKRNHLESKLTLDQIPTDLDKLKKYFEPSFLELAGVTKSATVIDLSLFICKRFDIDDLFSELTHIASCISITNDELKFQMTSNTNFDEIVNPEMEALKKLINGVNENKKLTSLKFSFEGEEHKNELTSRLPMYLVEKSLREYYDNHQLEFETDVVSTICKKNQEGEIEVQNEIQINKPHERFLVRLVHPLYNYFKDNLGTKDSLVYKDKKYYEIIAVLFTKCGVFYNTHIDEIDIIEKIKEWHLLSAES